MGKTVGKLSVESENIFPIIRDKLYDTQDAFLRELVSNGIDAITKRQALIKSGKAAEGSDPFCIKVLLDRAAGTLTIWDNGVGMTADEVDHYINDIAFSGTLNFVNHLSDEQSEKGQLIGQFGLGFYSAFMVADMVEIETLSCLPGSEAVHWVCNGSTMTFTMEPGSQTEVGSKIILHILPDSVFFQTAIIMKALEKYCSFAPVELYFADSTDLEHSEPWQLTGEEQTLVNDPHALWTRDPKELKKADYIEFYRRYFEDSYEPVSWLNLYNEELGVRGVLYFRHIDDSASSLTGDVRLYSRQIFVGSNVKEIVPDFLALQNGIVEIRELPLNVSRASLKADGYAAAISSYLAEQVGGFIQALCKYRREKYEGLWPELNPFVKLGILQNKKFKRDAIKAVLFRKSGGGYLTLEELRGAEEDTPTCIYYVSDPVQQAQYVSLYEKAHVDAVLMTHVVDTPFIRLLELEHKGLTFKRIDADLGALLCEADSWDEQAREQAEQQLNRLYQGILQPDTCIRAEYLKSPEITSLILLDEQTRRWQEVTEVYNLSYGIVDNEGIQPQKTFVVNLNAPLVTALLKRPDDPASRLIAQQLLSIARLSQDAMSEQDMMQYLESSSYILQEYANFTIMKG